MRRFEHDEAYEDEDVYDDDEPGYHPVDDEDEPDLDLNAPGLDIAGSPDGATDWDLGLTEDRLAELAGTDDLATCSHLEIRADATRDDLSGIGRAMPALARLRLSSSVVPAALITKEGVSPNVSTAPLGSGMRDNTVHSMLPINQDLPTELFTLPKAKAITAESPYASKDSLKLCNRLKVKPSELAFGFFCDV